MRKKKIEEFEIKKIKRNRVVYIYFNKIVPYICLTLTFKEWDRFLNFLKKTKSRLHLTKYKIQYSQYDIHTNTYHYIDSRPAHLEWSKTLRLLTSDKEKLKKTEEKFVWIPGRTSRADAKKNLVCKIVYLVTKDFTIGMKRKQFLRFRDYCINPDNLQVFPPTHCRLKLPK